MYVFTYEHAPIERTIYSRQVKDSNVRTMDCSCSRKLTFCWIWQQKIDFNIILNMYILLVIMMMVIMEQTNIDGYKLMNHHFNKLPYITTTTTVNTNHVQYNFFHPTANVITIPRKISVLKSSILDDIEDEEELVSFRSIASSYLKSKFLDCYGNKFKCYMMMIVKYFHKYYHHYQHNLHPDLNKILRGL